MENEKREMKSMATDSQLGIGARLRRGLLCLSFLVCHFSFTQAQSFTLDQVPDPKPNGYVSDPANLLRDRSALNQQLAALEAATQVQMAVVVLPSIGTEVPKDFANRLVERWGIGRKGTDNGLLLLIVMDQRRSELEVGYGLEAILTDLRSVALLERELVPRFREQDYDGGIAAVIQSIHTLVAQPDDPAVQDYLTDLDRADEPIWMNIGRWYLRAVVGGSVAFLLLWLVLTLSTRDLYRKSLRLRPLAWWLWAILLPVPLVLLRWLVMRHIRALRNAPRNSPTTGAALAKQDEQADDAYLSAGQRTEERVGSVDYDVWANPQNADDTVVLPYRDPFSGYSTCPSCHHLTLRTTSRTITAATYDSTGTGERIDDCQHCNYHKRSTYTIARKQRSSSSGGSSGGGGSSWGGGSSGGGGGGASW